MKVFVAGGSGAMGRRMVPQLVAGGYEVIAMTRDQGKASWLRRVGAQSVIADALDRAAVVAAVKRSEPEVVIHQLTGLTGVKSFRNFDKEFALTNRLRTEGTDYLLEAARAAGVRRIVAQSYGNWNYERTGSPVKTEQDPFDPHPPANQVRSLQAIRYVEDTVVNAGGIEGIALRYGNFYGPGTGLDSGGEIVTQVRQRKFPIVGDGAGIWSFVHMDDAAAAAIAAIEHGSTWRVQRRRRRAGSGGAMAARPRCRGRREAAAPHPGLARAAGSRRGRGVDDDADSWCLERQGEGRTRVGTPLPDLSRGVLERTR